MAMKSQFVLVMGLVVGVAVVVFGWHYCTAHTVEPEVLDRIEAGMDWEEVKGLVGTDLSPEPDGHGSFQVAIRMHDRWCMVDIFVDGDGKVRSWFHDH